MSHWCGTCDDIGQVIATFTAHVRTMSEREKAELRVQMRKQFRQPTQPEPLLEWPIIGSTVIARLHDGRKVQAVVKAIYDTVSGKKFQIAFDNITMKVGAEQILKQQ